MCFHCTAENPTEKFCYIKAHAQPTDPQKYIRCISKKIDGKMYKISFELQKFSATYVAKRNPTATSL